MAFQVKKAKREKIYVKVALMAPSGGGKTYGGLRLATGMAAEIKKQTGKDSFEIKMKIAKAVCFPEEYQMTMPKVKNQGAVGSCVAHSLSVFLEELYKDENKSFSVGFIYGYRPLGYSQNEGMDSIHIRVSDLVVEYKIMIKFA